MTLRTFLALSVDHKDLIEDALLSCCEILEEIKTGHWNYYHLNIRSTFSGRVVLDT